MRMGTLPMDAFDRWINLFSGVSIGAVVGGLCSVAAVIVQASLARRHDRAREQAAVNAFLSTVLDELGALWSRYIEGPGKRLEALRTGEPFMAFMPVYQDYFTFYTANSHLVSQIADPELRYIVVHTYASAKVFIDSFRANNDLLQRVLVAETLHRRTGDTSFEFEAHALRETMASFAHDLKTRHAELAQVHRRMTGVIEHALDPRSRPTIPLARQARSRKSARQPVSDMARRIDHDAAPGPRAS